MERLDPWLDSKGLDMKSNGRVMLKYKGFKLTLQLCRTIALQQRWMSDDKSAEIHSFSDSIPE